MMCRYIRLPGYPAKEDTSTGKHVIGYRANVFHHLYGHGTNDIKESQMKKKVTWVAIHHFDSRIRSFLDKGEGGNKKKQDLFRIPYDLGREIGLTDTDLCEVPTKQNKSEKTYYASPTIRKDAIAFELKTVEREYAIRRAATESVMSPTLPPQANGRKTPREK